MTENHEHLDGNFDLKVSDKLSADLKGLFEREVAIPAEVDRAILDGAGQRLVRHRRRRLLPWAIPTAAAAVIVFAVVLNTKPEPAKLDEGPSPLAPQRKAASKDVYSYSLAAMVSRGDVDLNGRVDILDAFKLARHIESGNSMNWKWDINGDGVVDRQDVDSVAFSAVSLDKGVL